MLPLAVAAPSQKNKVFRLTTSLYLSTPLGVFDFFLVDTGLSKEAQTYVRFEDGIFKSREEAVEAAKKKMLDEPIFNVVSKEGLSEWMEEKEQQQSGVWDSGELWVRYDLLGEARVLPKDVAWVVMTRFEVTTVLTSRQFTTNLNARIATARPPQDSDYFVPFISSSEWYNDLKQWMAQVERFLLEQTELQDRYFHGERGSLEDDLLKSYYTEPMEEASRLYTHYNKFLGERYLKNGVRFQLEDHFLELEEYEPGEHQGFYGLHHLSSSGLLNFAAPQDNLMFNKASRQKFNHLIGRYDRAISAMTGR